MSQEKLPEILDKTLEGDFFEKGTLKHELRIKRLIEESLENGSINECMFDAPPSIHVITGKGSYGTNDLNGHSLNKFQLGDHFSAGIDRLSVHGKIVTIKNYRDASYIFKISDGEDYLDLLVLKKDS